MYKEKTPQYKIIKYNDITKNNINNLHNNSHKILQELKRNTKKI